MLALVAPIMAMITPTSLQVHLHFRIIMTLPFLPVSRMMAVTPMHCGVSTNRAVGEGKIERNAGYELMNPPILSAALLP
jgi:hypothetical protein